MKKPPGWGGQSLAYENKLYSIQLPVEAVLQHNATVMSNDLIVHYYLFVAVRLKNPLSNTLLGWTERSEV